MFNDRLKSKVGATCAEVAELVALEKGDWHAPLQGGRRPGIKVPIHRTNERAIRWPEGPTVVNWLPEHSPLCLLSRKSQACDRGWLQRNALRHQGSPDRRCIATAEFRSIIELHLTARPAVRGSIRGGAEGSRLSFMGLPCANIFAGGHAFQSPLEWISRQDMEKSVMTLVELAKSGKSAPK